MKRVLLGVLLGGLAGSGCIGKKSDGPAKAESPAAAFSAVPGETQPAEPKPKLIVTPENALAGKVVKVNASARFVVLSFPVGHLPAMEQRLNVNRRGLRVGEVKITGPQQEENIVADIVAGDAEEGDEVTDK